MCFKSKSQPAQQVLPAQAVTAQPVSAAATVKTSVKDKDRGSDADIRSDSQGVGDKVVTGPTGDAGGDIGLGAKKKRKTITGLEI